ncbi:MAG: hypothetical protein MSC30_04925 [Gaiellaceae bacterium MAG52_C11]|nr:hypothetical protein [Candidatus Gaiellasilicea maunaloa]
MRVRFVGNRTKPSIGERTASAFLTVGKEYAVLSILASDTDGVRFLLLDDLEEQPGWHPASAFDLSSDSVPSNWRIAVGAAGKPDHLEIAPEPWLDPGFFNAYWADGGEAATEAHELFRRELAVILDESL